MEFFDAEGMWWLPDAPDSTVPGTLTYSADGLELRVYGRGLHPIQSRAAGEVSVFTRWEVNPIVHGELRDGRLVTLISAVGLAMPDMAVQVQSYRVQLAVIGELAHGAAFTGIRAEFDHLASWAGAPDLIKDLFSDPVQVHTTWTELMTTTWGDACLTLRSGAIGPRNWTSIHVDRSSDYSAELNSAQEWRELLSTYLRPFQDLLVLCLGRSVGMHRLELRPEGSDTWCDAFFVHTPVAAVSTESVHSARMPTLLTAATSPMPLAELLPRWLDLRDELEGVLVTLLAPFYAPFTYAEHQFANLVQSAEAYHHARRDIFGTADLPKAKHKERVKQVTEALLEAGLDADTTNWARNVIQARNDKPMRTKLEDVVAATGILGEEIADWIPDFARNLTQTRHNVSHGSAAPHHVLTAEERHWHGQVLLWVMRVRLLKDLGCADADIRALENIAFQFALEQLVGDQQSKS